MFCLLGGLDVGLAAGANLPNMEEGGGAGEAAHEKVDAAGAEVAVVSAGGLDVALAEEAGQGDKQIHFRLFR